MLQNVVTLFLKLDGASLIFISLEQDNNVNLLYRYFLHRAYGFEIEFKPNFINKQLYFAPLGFDNEDELKYYFFFK